MTTEIEKLSKNIVETGFEDFDKQDVEFAKNRLIDIVGCTLGGANATGNSALIDLVKQWGGKEEATILGFGVKAPAQNVAMVNATMVRSYDYEPSGNYFEGMAFPCHSTSVTSTTALTMAEFLNSSGKELLAALILGDDMLARLIAAADWQYALGDDSPWDCSGTMSKWGATAIAGKLLKLNIEQMVNAFGIAVDTVQCTKQSMQDGVESFKLHSGLGCRDGIFSAELAGKGFKGVRDSLLSKYGFLPAYFSHYLTTVPDVLNKDLGKKFYSGSGAGHKYYPCCGGNDLYIECTLQIMGKHDIDPKEINEIIAGVRGPRRGGVTCQPWDSNVTGQVKATFSVPYNVANILVRKSITKLEHFTDDAVLDPQVLAIAEKVKFVPMDSSPKKGVELIIKMKDGTSFEANADTFKGGPGRELTKEEIKDKFRSNVSFTKIISKENSEKALEMIDHLEEISNIREIVKLLCH